MVTIFIPVLLILSSIISAGCLYEFTVCWMPIKASSLFIFQTDFLWWWPDATHNRQIWCIFPQSRCNQYTTLLSSFDPSQISQGKGVETFMPVYCCLWVFWDKKKNLQTFCCKKKEYIHKCITTVCVLVCVTASVIACHHANKTNPRKLIQ